MEPDAEGSQRINFEQRQVTPLFNVNGQSDQDGDISGRLQNNRVGSENADVTSPAQNFAGESDSPRPEAFGDDEFESFHRSFAIGSNPLDSMVVASRPGFGNNLQEPMSTIADNSVQTPGSAVTGQQQQQPQHQQAQQPQQQQQHTQQHVNEEDANVVEARRSMMARSGDRHARGKLSGPKEGRFMRPDSAPSEPQIPPPQNSKRYTRHILRPPDILEGNERTNNEHSLKDAEHVVTCRGCDRALVVDKAAVIVRCGACSRVSPASSGSPFIRSRVASRK